MPPPITSLCHQSTSRSNVFGTVFKNRTGRRRSRSTHTHTRAPDLLITAGVIRFSLHVYDDDDDTHACIHTYIRIYHVQMYYKSRRHYTRTCASSESARLQRRCVLPLRVTIGRRRPSINGRFPRTENKI